MIRGQRERKKIVLFLVEGLSDINALEYGISELYEYVDPSIEVFFIQMQSGGDITSRGDVCPDNIARKIVSLFINPFLKEYGLYPKDLLEIIQITDTDGCYIDDSCITYKEGIDHIEYTSEAVFAEIPEDIIRRNRIKRDNLATLTSMYSLKVGSKTIPYSIFFFSCNMDHYISNEQNAPWVWKTTLAKEFSKKCINDNTLFQRTFLDSADCKRGLSYVDSWDYIKEGTNSLNAHSNLYLLITTLLNGKGGKEGFVGSDS